MFPEFPTLCLSQAPFCRKLVFQDCNHESRASHSLLTVIPAPIYFWREHIFASLQELCGVLAPSVHQAAARQAVLISHTQRRDSGFQERSGGKHCLGLLSPIPISVPLGVAHFKTFLF